MQLSHATIQIRNSFYVIKNKLFSTNRLSSTLKNTGIVKTYI